MHEDGTAAPAGARARTREGRTIFDPQLVFLLAALGALVALAWWRGGPELVRGGFGEGGELLLRFGLLIVVSFLAAGFAQALLPQELVQGALGRDAGIRGVALATAAGAVTPAGPFVSMPLAVTMLRAGASPAAVVAFLTAWSLLAVHRLVAWEIPIMGARFALARYAFSLVLSLLAGVLALWAERWLRGTG